MTEIEIQNAIRVALSEIGVVRRNNVGTFYTQDGRAVAVGIPGEPDLTLFLPKGKIIMIEVKTPTGRQSAKQRHFQKHFEKMGYEYIIMRSVEDAYKLIERIKGGGEGEQ